MCERCAEILEALMWLQCVPADIREVERLSRALEEAGCRS